MKLLVAASFACLLLIACVEAKYVHENFIEDNTSFQSPNAPELLKSVKLSKASTSGWKCTLCKIFVTFLKNVGEQKKAQDFIVDRVEDLCTALELYAPHICKSAVPVFKDEFFYVINHLLLSPEEACGYLLGPTCGKFYNPYGNWTIKIPSDKPPHRQKPRVKEGLSVLKVLHLTDLHHDLKYKVGSNADCGEPVCCRARNGFPSDPKKKAGRWGDYRNCDMPIHTLRNMLGNINKSHHIDYIFWTGDFPPHDDWIQTRTTQLESVQYLTDILMEFFPSTPVFPAMGNHESNPVDGFPAPSVVGKNSISWLYDKLNSTWTTWLDKDVVSATILKGAYYSVSPQPGYRILSLNMNYCNTKNWWLLTNMTDPANELTWVVNELLQAEKLKEKVHIIGHIPPQECSHFWSYNYNNIINRFEDTIEGTFFGHTHFDEFHLHYEGTSSMDKRATCVGYVAPSGTTYDYVNPAYRIYDIDGGNSSSNTWAVVDHNNYFLNITEANLSDDPRWELEYSAKQAFNMKGLNPSDWDQVVENFKINVTAFNNYYRYKFHMNNTADNICTGSCKKNEICFLQTAANGDTRFC